MMCKISCKSLLKCSLLFFILYILEVFGVLIHIFELDYGYYYSYQIKYETTYKNQSLYSYSWNQDNVCKDEKEPYITFLIKSALTNADKRNVIRQTWGLQNRFSDVHVKRVFLIGAAQDNKIPPNIYKESQKYCDIVHMDFIDNYYNNTLKIMLGMHWAVSNCPKCNFFMFVDDDYYVSTKNLIRFLKYISNSKTLANKLKRDYLQQDVENMYIGYVMQTAPHRHKDSKWFTTLKEYPYHLWPPYITAGAFILSKNALISLNTAVLHIPYFRFDDIFLANAAITTNVSLVHCDKFLFRKPTYNGPNSLRHVIASHGFEDSNYLKNVWNSCRMAGYA